MRRPRFEVGCRLGRPRRPGHALARQDAQGLLRGLQALAPGPAAGVHQLIEPLEVEQPYPFGARLDNKRGIALPQGDRVFAGEHGQSGERLGQAGQLLSR